MVDFRSSGGSLGIYKATKSLRGGASSSLDKPAGTLSSKSVRSVGIEAQKIISSAELSEDIPTAEKSYYMASLLQKQSKALASEGLAPASIGLVQKFSEQASEEQMRQLRTGLSESGIMLKQKSPTSPEEAGNISPLLLFGIAFIIGGSL